MDFFLVKFLVEAIPTLIVESTILSFLIFDLAAHPMLAPLHNYLILQALTLQALVLLALVLLALFIMGLLLLTLLMRHVIILASVLLALLLKIHCLRSSRGSLLL